VHARDGSISLTAGMESLRGKLLIASPALADPNFERAVVLITEHGDDGAMGIVLNRPSESEVAAVIPELEAIAGPEPIFVGGPVQPEALVVLGEFSNPDKAAWIVVAEVGLVSAQAELEELPEAVRRGRVYAGFSGWAPGQLEDEIDEESWIIEAPLPRELFPENPDTLWSDVLARMGGEYALVARMPEDPSLN
jgi:putative transcriptional regulator